MLSQAVSQHSGSVARPNGICRKEATGSASARMPRAPAAPTLEVSRKVFVGVVVLGIAGMCKKR